MKTINIAIDIDDFPTSMEVTKLKKQDSLDPKKNMLLCPTY